MYHQHTPSHNKRIDVSLRALLTALPAHAHRNCLYCGWIPLHWRLNVLMLVNIIIYLYSRPISL